jgi:hypothetical protein
MTLLASRDGEHARQQPMAAPPPPPSPASPSSTTTSTSSSPPLCPPDALPLVHPDDLALARRRSPEELFAAARAAARAEACAGACEGDAVGVLVEGEEEEPMEEAAEAEAAVIDDIEPAPIPTPTPRCPHCPAPGLRRLDPIGAGLSVRGESLLALQRSIPRLFSVLHQRAVLRYIDGDWPRARTLFLRAEAVLGRDDGPTRAVMEFMRGHGFEAPRGWAGSRDVGL